MMMIYISTMQRQMHEIHEIMIRLATYRLAGSWLMHSWLIIAQTF